MHVNFSENLLLDIEAETDLNIRLTVSAHLSSALS